MPCCMIKEDGQKCTMIYDLMPFFWFNDGKDLIEKKFKICQHHSNVVLGKLLFEETSLQRQLKTAILKSKSDNARKMVCGRCNCEIVDKRIKKCPRCGEDLFSSKRIITVEDRTAKDNIYQKIKKLRDNLNFARNKKCRMCGHPLIHPNCPQCNERHGDSKTISCCDFKSPIGHRRADCSFHITCGRIWLQSVTGIELLPTTKKQFTLEQSLSTPNIKGF